jgi:hypothetical protein
MYFLPFSGRTRFAAFEDLPAVEGELKRVLANDLTWEDLLANEVLSDKIVDGKDILGVFFKKDKTFITNNSGLPQVEFEGNPRSLLFVFGVYQIASSSGTFSYGNINSEFVRREISPHFYTGDVENLQGVWEGISRLQLDKVSKEYIRQLEDTIKKMKDDINRLQTRRDPLSLILPAIAAETGERNSAINDILRQINTLQAPVATGVINLTNHATKDELYDLLSRKASIGYVDGMVATKASLLDFISHIENAALHQNITIGTDVPSSAEHTLLENRVDAVEDRASSLEAQNPIQTITTLGGLTATNLGNGVWRLDASGIGIGTGDKPQETVFYYGGNLQLGSDTGGKWTAWEDAQIIGVRLTANTAPVGGPVVMDVKKDGVSIYTTTANRPTLLEGETEQLVALPDDVDILQGEKITVDIVNIGTTTPGADVTLQIRFEYVN